MIETNGKEEVVKWEHHVDREYSSNPEILYTRGSEGWELVTVMMFDNINWRFYWKRKVQEITTK